MKIDSETLFTRKKCAEFLSITLPTLHTWVKAGTIQAYKLGGRIYFKKSEILKSLKRVNAIEAE